MPLGDAADISNIGTDLFQTLGVDLAWLLNLHGVTMQVTRHDPNAAIDRYGAPEDAPAPFPVVLLITEQYLKDIATEAGGKRQEVLLLLGQPGTLLEGDILAYDGNNYDVWNVSRTTAESAIVADVYEAQREVAV